MNIGFFGGTFSPPHKGHLHSAKMFSLECSLDRLIIIPAKVSPFKTGDEKTAEEVDRLNMSRLCFDSLDICSTKVEISDFEISKEGTSYSYLTIDYLLEKHPGCNLFMYVGSDMFLSLEKWKNFEYIFSKCCIYTHARNKDELDILQEYKKKYTNLYNADIIISQDAPFCVSSTEIRTLLQKKDSQTLKNLLTDEVFRYIMENRLYFGE